MRQHTLLSLIAMSLFVACGPDTVTHVMPDGREIQLPKDATGTFLTMSGIPVGMLFDVDIQNANNGNLVKHLQLQDGISTFIPLAQGSYMISGYGNNGEWECFLHGQEFAVTSEGPTQLSVAGECHRIGTTGVVIDITLTEHPNLIAVIDPSSPLGGTTASNEVTIAVFQLRHDGEVDGVISHVYVTITAENGLQITSCEARDQNNAVTLEKSEFVSSSMMALSSDTQSIVIHPNLSYKLTIVCDATAQTGWVQLKIAGLQSNLYAPNGLLPIQGYWMHF